jgi:hypothetical protein
MLKAMSAVLSAAREHAGAIAFFVLAFVVLPLAVVSWKGGGTLEMRFQQWNALRQSIQSRDPAREAIDDPDADTALIESFLFPSDERRVLARARYEQWRADRDWWTMNAHLRSVEKDESGTSAIVKHEFEMKLLRDGVELERRILLRSETWGKKDGVWYLRGTEEQVLEVLEPRPVDFLFP